MTDEDNRDDGDSSKETDTIVLQTDAKKEEVTDPVKQTFEGAVDLYDIATWEVKTPVDRLAVSIAQTLTGQRRTLLFALAASLFVAQMVIIGFFLVEEPLLGVLSVLSVVPAFALVVLFWTSDPTEREPVALLAATFVLAVLFASFAAVTNSVLFPGFELLGLVGLPLFYFLVVGPVEEFVKVLAIRVHAYRSDAFQTVVDGAVYGAVAGLGFAAIENLVYIVLLSDTATSIETVAEYQYAVSTAVTRSFVGPGHVIFSAWAGFYLGLAKFNPTNALPIVIKGLLIASFIHATYNTTVTLLPLTTVGFILFVLGYHSFWFGLLYKKIGRYRTLYLETEEQSTHSRRASERKKQ